MAKSKFNVITHGLSGLVGELLVFRQRANKTIVANRPRPSSKPVKAISLENRARFTRASAYASGVMGDPILKAEYQLEAKIGQSAFNVAFADYQKAPEFYEDVDITPYLGEPGNKLTISVIDDFRVQSVGVEIKKPDGSTLEQGAAVQADNQLDWIYTATVVNTELPGSRIIFTATDLPGNKTLLEKLLV